MSDETLDQSAKVLDMREQIIRIDRAIAETQKFQDEAFKLRNEGLKLGRDRFLSPILAAIGITGVIVTIANLLLQHARL